MPKWVADKLLSEPEKLEAAERLPASGDPFIEATKTSDGTSTKADIATSLSSSRRAYPGTTITGAAKRR